MTLPLEPKSGADVEALLGALYEKDVPGLARRGEDWAFFGGPKADDIAKKAFSKFALVLSSDMERVASVQTRLKRIWSRHRRPT